MFLSPRKQNISEILLSSFWVFVAWILWSIFILIITFILSNYFNVVSSFEIKKTWINSSSLFPMIISILTFFWTSISSYFSYHILNIIDSEKYKKNNVILWQLSFLQIITYIFLAPLYIYIWLIDYNKLIIIFIIHITIITFWNNLLLELLNRYRYVLIWIYWSFVWLFISLLLSMYVFHNFWEWIAKLIVLLLLLPIINFLINFFKQIFELWYYYYYKYTSFDQIWNVFYEIEKEENENEKIEEEKNFI